MLKLNMTGATSPRPHMSSWIAQRQSYVFRRTSVDTPVSSMADRKVSVEIPDYNVGRHTG